MIELRWLVKEKQVSTGSYDMTTETEGYRVLQYRTLSKGDKYFGSEWSTWLDVPLVREQKLTTPSL